MTILKTIFDTVLEVMAEHKPDAEPGVQFNPDQEPLDANMTSPALVVLDEYMDDNPHR